MQALLYSFYCLFSFCLVLFLLNKIIQKEYLLLYVIYVCSFYTVLIYNVANSLWTAILIGYLIIYLVSIKKIEFNNFYFFVLLYYSSSSSASIVLLIPLIYLFFNSNKKTKSAIIFFWIILFSIFFLPNLDSDRTNVVDNLLKSMSYLKNDFYLFSLFQNSFYCLIFHRD